jgi:hypothetical protein
LVVAAALLALFFRSSYSPAEDLQVALTNALIGTVERIFLTPGGLACLIVLSGLFYRFRTPRDTGAVDDGYELLERAVRLERTGQVQEALKAYEYIASRYSHTTAGQDAQKSIESLKAQIG